MLSHATTPNVIAAQRLQAGDPSPDEVEGHDVQREEASHPAKRSRPHRPCPRCGSPRVHRSRRRGFIEHALGLAGLKMRRCHACGLRFTRLGDSVILPPDIGRGLRRLGQVALAAAGVLLVLGIMFWLTTRQPPE